MWLHHQLPWKLFLCYTCRMTMTILDCGTTGSRSQSHLYVKSEPLFLLTSSVRTKRGGKMQAEWNTSQRFPISLWLLLMGLIQSLLKPTDSHSLQFLNRLKPWPDLRVPPILWMESDWGKCPTSVSNLEGLKLSHCLPKYFRQIPLSGYCHYLNWR